MLYYILAFEEKYPVPMIWYILRFDGGDGLQIWKIPVNILKKRWWTVYSGWFSNLGIGQGLITAHH